MKIKLVTFLPQTNFGTSLQGYALNLVLKKMGHDVEFIYNRRESRPFSFKSYVKRLVKMFLPKHLVELLKEKVKTTKVNQTSATSVPYVIQLPNHRILKVLSKLPCYRFFVRRWYYDNLQKRKVYKFTFEDGNFNMKRLFVASDYKAVTKDADLFITGSDQIWNPFCFGYNPMMFLEFVMDKRCIAYSSSISQPSLPKSLEPRIKSALEKFSHIAVREQLSVEMLNKLLGRRDVRLVVDPTYLLSADEWASFSNKAEIEFDLPQKYIFCYFVGGGKRSELYERMVQEVKEFTGITDVINLECYDRSIVYGGGMNYKDAGPYEWVYLLKNASYICMDSFHATVFALKFKKEFVHVMKNTDDEVGSQNTRMYDLLTRYGLLYKNYGEKNTDWQRTVDYHRVTPLIEDEIKDSMEYLISELDNN